jgi:hypothetical protein
MKHSRSTLPVTILFALIAGAHISSGQGVGNPILQIMGTSANWADSSVTGHAFVCIALPTNSGIKEDCYGFYPNGAAGSIFGGPGVVSSEFDFNAHPPTRFSNIVNSVTKTITLQQRQNVLAAINGHPTTYSLTSSNCVTFANELARAAGLKAPEDTSYTTPESYVAKLKALNP